MKFLPVEEFEKRQKSMNRNNFKAITNSMSIKIGFQIDDSTFTVEVLPAQSFIQIIITNLVPSLHPN